MAKLNSGTRIYGNVTIDTFATATGNVTGGNILTPGLISATGNITGGNVLGGANVNATTHTGTTVSVSGNITGGNVLGGANVNSTLFTGTTVSVSGNITGGNVLGGANVNATTHTGTTVSVTGNITGGNIATAGILSGSNNLIINSPSPQAEGGQIILAWANISGLTGQANSTWNIDVDGAATNNLRIFYQNAVGAAVVPITVSSTTNAVSMIGALSTTGNITGGNILGGANVNATTLTGTTVSVSGNVTAANLIINGTAAAGFGVLTVSGNIQTTATTGTANIGNATNTFNTVHAKATTAQYADLAEQYVSDADYPPGTVLIFGGEHEVTADITSHSTAIAGVVSENPSYLMNAGLQGAHVVAVALLGRVPCQVQGVIRKGDLLVASDAPGVAQQLDLALYTPGCVIGKSLENYNSDKVGTIEIAVGVK